MKKATDIQIRYAKRQDINSIASFLHDCWQAEYRQIITDDYLDTMSVKERRKGLLRRYDEGAWDFLMMFDGKELIGASVFGEALTQGYEKDGEIAAIYLKTGYIGKGHGHTLFTKVEQALSSKGYTHFVLDLLAGNKRALAFYLAHGYEKVADRHISLGEKEYPLVVLRKEKIFCI